MMKSNHVKIELTNYYNIIGTMKVNIKRWNHKDKELTTFNKKQIDTKKN